jgi:hypothetical protein
METTEEQTKRYTEEKIQHKQDYSNLYVKCMDPMPFSTSRPSTSWLGKKPSLRRRAKVMVVGEWGQSPPLLAKTAAKVSQPTGGPLITLGSNPSQGSEGPQATLVRHPLPR